MEVPPPGVQRDENLLVGVQNQEWDGETQLAGGTSAGGSMGDVEALGNSPHCDEPNLGRPEGPALDDEVSSPQTGDQNPEAEGTAPGREENETHENILGDSQTSGQGDSSMEEESVCVTSDEQGSQPISGFDGEFTIDHFGPEGLDDSDLEEALLPQNMVMERRNQPSTSTENREIEEEGYRRSTRRNKGTPRERLDL